MELVSVLPKLNRGYKSMGIKSGETGCLVI